MVKTALLEVKMLKKQRAIIAANRNWIILATAFFAGGFIFAFYAVNLEKELFISLFGELLKQIEELGKEAFSGSLLSGVFLIMMNNIGAMAEMVVFGVFLGIPTLLGLFGNGALIGMVAALLAAQAQAEAIPFMLVSILPHGIFELPAFFISGALGLKIGYNLVFPPKGLGRWQSIKRSIEEITSLLPLLLIMVILAAVIEVIVTPQLISLFFPGFKMPIP